jgi:dCMP deaminase
MKDTQKRQDYLSWDEYFMAVALLSAERSKDPNTQVGACIASRQNKIVGVGYNGFPIGCSDDELPWNRQGAFLTTKYPYVCHAELNAVLNAISTDLTGCRIYVGLFPCNECTKVIIQSGIGEIIYLSDKYHETDPVKAAKRMLDLAGVSYRRFTPQRLDIALHFAVD